MPSQLFRAQRRYAEAYGDAWCILSAEYGLILPYKVISPYDTHISDHVSEGWQEQVMARVRSFEELGEEPVEVEVIAGGDYAERLIPYIEACGYDYSLPFEGQRYATRRDNMIAAAREVENRGLADFA